LGIVVTSSGIAQSIFDKTNRQAEIEQGRRGANEIERTTPLCTNATILERVNRISTALIAQIQPKDYPYQVRVLAIPEPNAFNLPGGFIYLHEGLIALCPDDDTLSALIGHEMAHSSHRHWANRTTKIRGAQIVAIIAILAGADKGGAINNAVALTSLRYSRSDEYDADQTGQYYAWAAGYEPLGAVELMKVIEKFYGTDNIPSYLSTHPKTKDRIKRLQVLADQLKQQLRPSIAETPLLPPQKVLVGELPTASLVANPYFPLAVGNEWTYCVQKADAKSYYLVRVVGAIPVSEGTVYRAETYLDKGLSVAYQLFTTGSEVWRRNRLTVSTSPWQTEYVMSATTEEPVTRDGWQYILVGKEPISLPCGSFPEALHIRKKSDSLPSTQDLWFVENVGLVKRSSLETGVTEVLASYKKGKP
jgi:hypothetical protein